MTGGRHSRRHATSLAAGLAFSLSVCSAALDVPLLVTEVPRSEMDRPAGWQPGGLVRATPFRGARIVVLSPTGETRWLSEGFASAADPDVSFDGQRALFAGRREGAEHWRIWEIGIDGQALRPVSPDTIDASAPIYVSTLFTLDSPEPWFTTVFVGRERATDENGLGGRTSLYNVRLDGGELRRLTFSPHHNLDPFQMWDGRVLYAAEKHSQEPGGGMGRVSLHAVHVEGADMEQYGGTAGHRIQRMPCATEGGLVVFVEPDEAQWDQAGHLACVSQSRPTASYRRLTEPGQAVWLHPAPLRGNTVLVARRSLQEGANFGIAAFDADTGRWEPVFNSAGFHAVQAKPLRPRPRPDGHSTVVNPKFNTGTFYGLNCYTADEMREAHLQPGSIKRVRFIEGSLQPLVGTPGNAPLSPLVPRRLLGEAPVETDGSFHVEVPADIPILVQTLDERGMALGTCGWIWVKPKETRGCIGCHEDPELVPENEYVQALRRPSTRLTLPAEQRREVSFRHDIVPVLRQSCAAPECHGGSHTGLRLEPESRLSSEAGMAAAYAALLSPEPGAAESGLPRPGKYVDAGRARTSWLIWQLAGSRTERPWDHDAHRGQLPPRKITLMPPAGSRPSLSAEQFKTFVQWIDLGAQYDAGHTVDTSTSLPRTNRP